MRHWQKTPFVTLEEIEGLPPKEYAAITQGEYLNLDSFTYFEEHSLLDPHQFILRQDAKSPIEVEKTHSAYHLTAYLGMHYDAVAFSFLAEPFYRAQIREALPEDAVEIPVTVEGIDACDLFCSQEENYLFMRKGKKILFVNHRGEGELLPALERFAALLQEDSGKVYPFV